jgi:hypothetical protein
MTCIVSNILYTTYAFGLQFKFLIKLSISIIVFFFFSLVKFIVRFLILKINQYYQNKKNYHVLKTPSRLTQSFFSRQ